MWTFITFALILQRNFKKRNFLKTRITLLSLVKNESTCCERFALFRTKKLVYGEFALIFSPVWNISWFTTFVLRGWICTPIFYLNLNLIWICLNKKTISIENNYSYLILYANKIDYRNIIMTHINLLYPMSAEINYQFLISAWNFATSGVNRITKFVIQYFLNHKMFTKYL